MAGSWCQNCASSCKKRPEVQQPNQQQPPSYRMRIRGNTVHAERCNAFGLLRRTSSPNTLAASSARAAAGFPAAAAASAAAVSAGSSGPPPRAAASMEMTTASVGPASPSPAACSGGACQDLLLQLAMHSMLTCCRKKRGNAERCSHQTLSRQDDFS